MREHSYFVYIMASRSLTLYIGFTSDLMVRIQQHKDGIYEGFSKQYHCHRLVYFERYQDVHRANRTREATETLFAREEDCADQTAEPGWVDLSEDWGKPVEPFSEPS